MAQRPPTRSPATRQSRRPGIQLGEVAARGLIMAAAARVFSEVGVRAASVEKILKISKVSRRTSCSPATLAKIDRMLRSVLGL